MSPYDNAGRIHKSAFMVSSLVFLAVCVISVCGRFYIRIQVQKRVAVDDAFLLFGLACLMSALAVTLTVIDAMYVIETALYTDSGPGAAPPQFLEQAVKLQRILFVNLLLWCSTVSIKLSYLFLFRKLIDRIPSLIRYWWFITVLVMAIFGYGLAAYILACPQFNTREVLQCGRGSHQWRTVQYSLSRIILDIASDILILYIPIRLIWQIQIRWTQKAALTFSLCLIIVIIIITVVRIPGLRAGNTVDFVWETYWQVISVEVGLIMTAITAFRAFFVSRSNEGAAQSSGGSSSVYGKSLRRFKRSCNPRMWQAKFTRKGIDEVHKSASDGMINLYEVKGSKTGVHTFISGQGKAGKGASHVMRSQGGAGDDDICHLTGSNKIHQVIEVKHEISSKSERVSWEYRHSEDRRESV